jgi:hypothetical protein
MNDLTWLLYKTSIKTQWDLNHRGDYITVIKWWSPSLLNGERIILNEKIILEKVNWLPKFKETHEFRLDEGQLVKVVIGMTVLGTTGCHIYVEDKLVGGEVHKKIF